MVDPKSTLSIITLNTNGPNTSYIYTVNFVRLYNKNKPSWPPETHFKYKAKDRLQVKDQ